jgi:hypothetical protein
MAQQRKRKAGQGSGANGTHHLQTAQQAIEDGDSPSSAGNGTNSHHLHDSIAALAYDLYERRGRADGFDVDDWLKAEELLASQACGVQGT